MSFVFWQHPPVIVLFLLAAVSVVPAARLRLAVPLPGALCVVCTAAMLLAALACAVPYEEILLLLLVVLLLFFVLAKEGKVETSRFEYHPKRRLKHPDLNTIPKEAHKTKPPERGLFQGSVND